MSHNLGMAAYRLGPPDFKAPPETPPPAPAPPNPKKRRKNQPPPPQPPPCAADLLPPPPQGYGDTVIASNPFDDSPSLMHNGPSSHGPRHLSPSPHMSPMGRGVSPMGNMSPMGHMGVPGMNSHGSVARSMGSPMSPMNAMPMGSPMAAGPMGSPMSALGPHVSNGPMGPPMHSPLGANGPPGMAVPRMNGPGGPGCSNGSLGGNSMMSSSQMMGGGMGPGHCGPLRHGGPGHNGPMGPGMSSAGSPLGGGGPMSSMGPGPPFGGGMGGMGHVPHMGGMGCGMGGGMSGPMGGCGPGGMFGPKPMPVSAGKVYPPDQPMVFNPQNPNAPPIYPCGVCHKEVHDNDQAILCESGCNFWFHRGCTGLTEPAFQLLTAEVYAEWVCDKCLTSKNIPLVKFKP